LRLFYACTRCNISVIIYFIVTTQLFARTRSSIFLLQYIGNHLLHCNRWVFSVFCPFKAHFSLFHSPLFDYLGFAPCFIKVIGHWRLWACNMPSLPRQASVGFTYRRKAHRIHPSIWDAVLAMFIAPTISASAW
jgi:hypothetical protein